MQLDSSHSKLVILGIESSCDDTSASICVDGKILSNVIYSQKIHEEYGGVVPELASRKHEQKIVFVVDKAIKDAGIEKSELSAIAFTRGPGLVGSLLVGLCFGKAMALALGIPIIEVNHIQAHVLSPFIESEDLGFPFLSFVVSGGHTQLVLVKDYFSMDILGTTIDDAAGEAFDKTAKMLGLDYPGGPLIDTMSRGGDEIKFQFAKPRVDGLNFSFSGLKTSVLYFIQKQVKENPNFVQENLHDLCASIQKTIVDILISKLDKALTKHPVKYIAISGGVSANSKFRESILNFGKQKGLSIHIPSMQYCTDNAAMISMVGYYKYLRKDFACQDIEPLVRGYEV